MRHAMKLTACLALLLAATSWAIVPPQSGQASLTSKAFFKPELYLPIINTPLQEARAKMSSLSASAWDDFFARNGKGFNVYLDTRTGSVSSVEGVVPLIPGNGAGNAVTLSSLRQKLGRTVSKVDETVVGDLIVKFISDNKAALGVDPMQLGQPRVTQVSDILWQVHIPQQINGVAVRDARVAATINSGNLILLGTEAWANVSGLTTMPSLQAAEAMASAGDSLGLYETPSDMWLQPTLEVVPMVLTNGQQVQTYIGALGAGYTHKLVWTYGFQNKGEAERWRVTVDAQTGELLALEDDNHYFDAKIKGGIYPSTNTEVCPNDATCGTLQPDSPMPWTDTGLPAPNNFTDGAGVYDYSGTGTVTTTLTGKYVKISDGCGTPSFSSSDATGTLDMGGVNGNHDCVTGGGGAGNTASARSCFYELGKLNEQARGWLPSNTWLKGQLTANVNLPQTCNAFWNGTSVNFYKSGGGCRNTGEIGAVFDHEWGHGIDNFDANGTLSSSSEGYADIAANYRLQASCVGHGFFQTINNNCGQTADGTGFNSNEAQTGSPWCATDCSGVRDSDYAKHNPPTPQTPANFTCSRCNSGTGPCGKQVHCSAGPTRQAAWDLVARDLRAAPFNLDAQSAFVVGNKIFYQGSGNVGSWHGCDCAAGTSDGCGATNGYMQWLAADDDDGNLQNGTPHMTAIYAAFNRHGMACQTPAPVNSGCAGGPTAAPTHSAASGESQIDISWNSVPGASEYWVMKTEGFAGCNFGKARVATVTGNTYTDPEVANGRSYCYSVIAAGSSSACYTAASTCTCVSPACAPPSGMPTLAGPNDGTTDVEFLTPLDWSDVEGTRYEVQVATDASFNTIIRTGAGLTSSDWAVTPALPASTTYYWRVRAVTLCGGASSWSPPNSFTTRACIALGTPSTTSPADGATGVAYAPVLDWSDVPLAENYDVELSLDSAFSTLVASGTNVSASSWTVPTSLIPNTKYYWRARAKDVCGQSAHTTASFTTANVCSASTATYNANYKAPFCDSGCGCSTSTLVRGRGTMTGGNETNRPNTLGGTCVDGNAGAYHVDESIDKLVINSTNRGTIVPGSAVKLDVTVWCAKTTDRVDLYYATDAASPSWTPLVTGLACTGTGAKVFSTTFNVGATPGAHAVRAQIRYGGVLNTCSAGSYNERDDMVFTVGVPFAQATSPSPTTLGRAVLKR